MRKSTGFTLAELLIALAILGVIATFTIPKVLQSASSGQNTAVAKEAAGMISGAMQVYKLNNTIASGTTNESVLTPFMNYVKTTATAADADANIGGTGKSCATAGVNCLVLHNGGVLAYDTGAWNNATTGTVYFNFDPDGAGTQTPVTFTVGITGRLTTGANADIGGTQTAPTGGTIDLIGTDPTYIANWN